MTETPELDKMREAIAPRQVNDTLTDFVDWLTSDGIILARYGAARRRTVPCPACRGRGFDTSGLSKRQQQLLRLGQLTDDARPPCPGGCHYGKVHEEYLDPESLQPLTEPWSRLFARFLGLDEAAMDRERQALLEELGSR